MNATGAIRSFQSAQQKPAADRQANNSYPDTENGHEPLRGAVFLRVLTPGGFSYPEMNLDMKTGRAVEGTNREVRV
jgi:hypothetical protein